MTPPSCKKWFSASATCTAGFWPWILRSAPSTPAMAMWFRVACTAAPEERVEAKNLPVCGRSCSTIAVLSFRGPSTGSRICRVCVPTPISSRKCHWNCQGIPTLVHDKRDKEQFLISLDLQSDRRAGWQRFQRVAKTLQRGHGLAVQRSNHITSDERHFHTRTGRARRNKNSEGIAEFRNHASNPWINFNAQDSQRRNQIFLRVSQRRHLIHVPQRLRHRHVKAQAVFPAKYVQMNFLPIFQRKKMKHDKGKILRGPGCQWQRARRRSAVRKPLPACPAVHQKSPRRSFSAGSTLLPAWE